MARGGFHDDNAQRDYPLVPTAGGRPSMIHPRLGAVPLPTQLLVDFSCLLGLDSGWSPSASTWLASVERVYESAVVRLRCDAPGLAGMELAFFASRPGPADASARFVGGGQPPAACGDRLLWEGTILVGSLDDLMDLLADGEALTAAAGALPLEPALAQDLSRTYVRSINLANAPRVVVSPSPGCGDPPAEATGPATLVVGATCLGGDVALRAGYNAAIRQNDRDNSLRVSAVLDGGAGQPCGEVPLGVESPPAGSTLLSGGPSCGDVITSVNGLSAAAITLAGGGDRARVYMFNNRLIVDLTRAAAGIGGAP